MQPPPRPQGKVHCLPGGLFLPCLVWKRQLVPLGEHACVEAAECAYDVGKLLLVRKLCGDAARIDVLKLHRPAAAYTSHPLWQQLSGGHCSFEEACSLLAGGLAADFFETPNGRALRHPPVQQPAASAATSASAGAEVDWAPGPSDTEDSGSSTDSGGSYKDADRVKHRYNTSWSGLEPQDSGMYSLRLSASVANGTSAASIPGRYLHAISGTGQPPTTLHVTTPDGRQHEWPVRYYAPQGLHYLNRTAAAIASLGAKRGDYLCFAPTGPAAASITLQRAAEHEQALPKADVLPRQQQQPAGASGSTPGSGKPSPGHCAAENSSRSSLSDQPPVKRHRSSGWEADQTDSQQSRLQGSKEQQLLPAPQPPPHQQQAQQQVAPQEQPRQKRQLLRQPNQKFATSWQGLEPADLHCYTVPLSNTSVGHQRKLSIPARYAQAAFGVLPISAEAPVTVDIHMPDGRVHTWRLSRSSQTDSSCFLSRLSSFMVSLGAAVGDQLQLRPRGPGAVDAVLLKQPIGS